MVIYSGFPHWKWWLSIVMLNYQRVSAAINHHSSRNFISRLDHQNWPQLIQPTKREKSNMARTPEADRPFNHNDDPMLRWLKYVHENPWIPSKISCHGADFTFAEKKKSPSPEWCFCAITFLHQTSPRREVCASWRNDPNFEVGRLRFSADVVNLIGKRCTSKTRWCPSSWTLRKAVRKP